MINRNLLSSLIYVTPYLVSYDCDDISEYHPHLNHHSSTIPSPCKSICMQFCGFVVSVLYAICSFFLPHQSKFTSSDTKNPDSTSYIHIFKTYSSSNQTVILFKNMFPFFYEPAQYLIVLPSPHMILFDIKKLISPVPPFQVLHLDAQSYGPM